jgi:hypothetical protein
MSHSGLWLGAGVNQLRESETETVRTGGETEWNWGGAGEPTVTCSKGETNGDGSYSKDYGKWQG